MRKRKRKGKRKKEIVKEESERERGKQKECVPEAASRSKNERNYAATSQCLAVAAFSSEIRDSIVKSAVSGYGGASK